MINQMVPNDYQMVPQDHQIVPNDYWMVQNDSQTVPNYYQKVQNDYQMVQNDSKMVPNDYQIVPNYSQMVPNNWKTETENNKTTNWWSLADTNWLKLNNWYQVGAVHLWSCFHSFCKKNQPLPASTLMWWKSLISNLMADNIGLMAAD